MAGWMTGVSGLRSEPRVDGRAVSKEGPEEERSLLGLRLHGNYWWGVAAERMV